MARTWLYGGASLAVLSAALFQVYIRSPALNVHGVHREIHPINHNNCQSVPEITILSSGIMYLACAGTIESRTAWMPTLDALNATAVLTRSTADYLATYDTSTGAITKLAVRGLSDPRGLNLHGMDVVPDELDPTMLWIYLVNHRPEPESPHKGANSVIEILKTRVGADYVEWVQTVEDAHVIVTPNDIVGANNGKEFWFTNDNGAKVGIMLCSGSVLRLSAIVILHMGARELQFIFSGAMESFGDGSFWVGDYRNGQLTVHKPNKDKTLQHVATVMTGLPLDNLALSADGSIIAAAIPKVHLLSDAMNNRSSNVPSTVLRVPNATLGGNYKVEKIYEDEGQLGSFGTTAAMYEDRLFIHGESPQASLPLADSQRISQDSWLLGCWSARSPCQAEPDRSTWLDRRSGSGGERYAADVYVRKLNWMIKRIYKRPSRDFKRILVSPQTGPCLGALWAAIRVNSIRLSVLWRNIGRRQVPTPLQIEVRTHAKRLRVRVLPLSELMSENVSTVLPQGAGYGVGIGLFFSAFMLGLTWIQARYTGFSPSNSEEFSSASRSVKPGLIASGIVSAWTWAATLLQSSAVAYKYGISGPWWYGAGRCMPFENESTGLTYPPCPGATIQVLLFAMLAAKLKLNSPNAHTFLEIIGARWGTAAHLIFLFFGLATNIIVSSMLILGGSATVTDLTGMNTIAACFLIPIGVAIYVVAGGMRATLLCDYTHTAVLFAIILTFIFTAYSTSPKIGSPSRMHELLVEASIAKPVAGNAQGSYLTIFTRHTSYNWATKIPTGNFATVFNDQAYWQRAIASKPQSCVKAYLLGGLAWFSIPFTFATTLGLAAVALHNDPDMRPLSPADVSAGLPAPSAAAALLGTSGAAAMLILLFLAVTSATSAELIAVSSLLTYDVYKRYINPRATEAQIMRVSHLMYCYHWTLGSNQPIVCSQEHGVAVYFHASHSGFMIELWKTYFETRGTLLGSAVVPIALCITWQKASKIGCIVGAISGLFAGIIAWLVTTSTLNDKVINVTTSGGDYEMLAGNLAAIGVGGIISVVWSYLRPDDFSFDVTRALNAPVHPHAAPTTGSGTHTPPEDEKKQSDIGSGDIRIVPAEDDDKHDRGVTHDEDLDPIALKGAFRFAAWSSIGLLIVMIILIPFPLFFSQVVFGTKGLTTWVAVGIAWTFLAAFTVVIYPLYESRQALFLVSKGIVKVCEDPIKMAFHLLNSLQDIFHPGSGKYSESSPAKEGTA
ncbi:urea transporter [Rhizoctonia solani AG-1 IA]|uniref:Urea transporter n=1 Tax=Thanatephorus cucumeris (strain AG1-IA) TaxID=983506 RepID=L8WMZ2_THACA|nr:urea transporter [Rhizoctonia solani AG-1 IA]